MITLYSKPACVQCTATKRAFARAGVECREIDVTTDPAAAAEAERLAAIHGRTMPIVVAGSLIWSGNQPDMIKRVIEGER